MKTEHTAACLQSKPPAQQDGPAVAKGSKETMPLRLSDLIRRQQAALRAQAGVPDPIKRPAERLEDARKRSRLTQPQASAQISPGHAHLEASPCACPMLLPH